MIPPTAGRRVTLRDVADRAGVDRSVVSRVMSRDPQLRVTDATRSRVLTVVAELDYHPDAIARSLRTRRTDTIGLLIPDFANPVYASIIAGAEAAAARRGCVLLTGSLTAGAYTARQFAEVLGRGRVDGLLLGGAGVTQEVIDVLGSNGVPWLLVNRRMPAADRWVVLDDDGAAALGVAHLVAHGHRRIAHIAGPRDADTARRREAGYRGALEAAGLPLHTQLVLSGGYSSAGGADAMRRLLALPDPPTAVLVANVASAIGALGAAAAAGVRVPDALSVVAVHDLALADHLHPALTTVSTPLAELGARAVDLLATTAADAVIHETIDGPMRLVARASSARAPS